MGRLKLHALSRKTTDCNEEKLITKGEARNLAAISVHNSCLVTTTEESSYPVDKNSYMCLPFLLK